MVRHANTTHEDISFSAQGQKIKIVISDDGQGFQVEKVFDEAVASGGLTNIRHRLHLLGCDLSIQSQPGQGTRVIIHVPARQVKP